MLGTDPTTAHYQIDPDRLDLVEEFRRAPKGPYSPELQKVMHRMRWSGEGGRFALMPVVPGKTWMLTALPTKRGAPVVKFPDRIFTSLEDAEWAAFKMRWEAITGRKIPEELSAKP
ncbi:MAG TPA: hypothetical protein VN112_24860 [Ensifer sp.]|nr:hypothetical protein [Ensifer sp.]